MALIKLNNRGVRNVSTFGSVAPGSVIFIKKLTASSSGDLSFVDGSSDVVLDDTYKEYMFTFNNIHPETDNAEFTVGFRDGSTDYDATKTTTYFNTYHDEADSGAGVGYNTGQDLAQSTGFQTLAEDVGSDADQNIGGYLHLFSPSNTTFVKHFISRMCVAHGGDYIQDVYVAGYCNVTAAIDAVQFKFSSGDIDAGDICLYGIK